MLMRRYLFRFCVAKLATRRAQSLITVKYHNSCTTPTTRSFCGTSIAAGATNEPNSCYTYTLDSSPATLYVAITSKCSSRTLPETRGPNFLLPAEVVEVLCRVRDVENETDHWKNWYSIKTADGPSKLVLSPPHSTSPSLAAPNLISVDELLREIQVRFDEAIKNSQTELNSIVIAGEGEPTLRLMALLELVKGIRKLHKQSLLLSSSKSSPLAIRVNTNGLVQPETQISNRGRIESVAQQLISCGIDFVSVAFMTHDADQYAELMQPSPSSIFPSSEKTNDAHAIMCRFVADAVQVGLQVQATGVDRPEIDKEKTEQLASSLGVTRPFLWRTYFP